MRPLALATALLLTTSLFSPNLFSSAQNAAPLKPAARTPLWITAYYAGWQQERLPPGEIDFRALTHLVHFSVLPKADGTLDWTTHNLDTKSSQATVAAAHGAGKKILMCVGGAQTAAGFRGAMSDEKRASFVRALGEGVQERGYDGLDVDMEPIEASDTVLYTTFIRELRAELRRRNPQFLLTAAVGEHSALFVSLQDQFDQINLMTYDISGTWEGWVTWHNSPLKNDKVKFPDSTRLLPSVDSKVREWIAAGIKPAKLGLGLAFYGYVWSGATAPNQSTSGVKTRQISYYDLMQQHFQPSRYHWDEGASVPYLSLDAPETAQDAFISFDDERSLRLKIEYARQMGLGGAIIWELGSGYRSDQPAGKRDPLLQAVRQAISDF